APGRAVAAGARFLDQPGLPPPLVVAVAGSLAAREAATPAQLDVVHRALVSALAAAEGSPADGGEGSDPVQAALLETLALIEQRQASEAAARARDHGSAAPFLAPPRSDDARPRSDRGTPDFISALSSCDLARNIHDAPTARPYLPASAALYARSA